MVLWLYNVLINKDNKAVITYQLWSQWWVVSSSQVARCSNCSIPRCTDIVRLCCNSVWGGLQPPIWNLRGQNLSFTSLWQHFLTAQDDTYTLCPTHVRSERERAWAHTSRLVICRYTYSPVDAHACYILQLSLQHSFTHISIRNLKLVMHVCTLTLGIKTFVCKGSSTVFSFNRRQL